MWTPENKKLQLLNVLLLTWFVRLQSGFAAAILSSYLHKAHNQNKRAQAARQRLVEAQKEAKRTLSDSERKRLKQPYFSGLWLLVAFAKCSLSDCTATGEWISSVFEAGTTTVSCSIQRQLHHAIFRR